MPTPDKKRNDRGDAGVNPFRTVGPDGRPVLSRFSDAASLRSVYETARDNDSKDSTRRANILGMYELRLPWDPEKLRAAGLGDRTNINFGGLRGAIDARAAAVTDLALDTVDLVELTPAAAELAGPDAEDVASAVAYEFSQILRDGLDFLPTLATMVRERDLNGFGPAMWPDPFGFKPVAVLRANVKLHDEAPHLSSRNELVMVEATLPTAYAAALFDDAEASATAGWNLPALRRYMVKVFSEGQSPSRGDGDDRGTSPAEALTMQARENRLFETRQFESLKVIHAFVRELSGDRKVSHYMIPAVAVDGQDEFLLNRYGAYDGMDNCVVWLPASVTEGRAAALRGIASYIYPTEALRNARLCAAADAADQLLRIHLRRRQGGAPERMTLTEQGAYVVLPDDVEHGGNALVNGANVKASVEVTDALSRIATSNTLGNAGVGNVSDPVFSGADRQTKEEAASARERGERAERGFFVASVVVFDLIFRETFRRFMSLVNDPGGKGAGVPEVAAFIRRCEARGIGAEVLRRVPSEFQIRLCRDIVSGGGWAKARLLEGVLSIGGNLDERGRLTATRDLIRCRMGSKAADAYRPLRDRDAEPSDAASHAVLENNDILELSAVLAAPDQMHWTHIPVHGRLLAQISDAVQQGQVEDPQRMLDTMQLVSEHIQAHIAYGGRQIGREAAAKAALRDLRSMRPIQQALTIMAANIDRVRRAEEEKRQREMEDLQKRAEGNETQVKMHEIDVDAALEMRKQDLMHEARMSEAGSRAQTDMFRARAKQEIDRIAQVNRRYIEAAKITANPPPSTEGLVPPETF